MMSQLIREPHGVGRKMQPVLLVISSGLSLADSLPAGGGMGSEKFLNLGDRKSF